MLPHCGQETNMMTNIGRNSYIVVMMMALVIISTSCTKDRNDNVPAGVILPADVSFPGLQMRPGTDRSTYTIIGRIKNRSSRSTIAEVTLNVWMEDVLESGASTSVAPVALVLRQEVPPLESRSFEETVVFRGLPKPRGRHEWNYALTGVKGK
jgi:hypothetical protein